MHTHTQTNTPKPNFIRVLKMASHSEGIIYKVRSCELERFIRGLPLINKATSLALTIPPFEADKAHRRLSRFP
jgi:hypothetical protein